MLKAISGKLEGSIKHLEERATQEGRRGSSTAKTNKMAGLLKELEFPLPKYREQEMIKRLQSCLRRPGKIHRINTKSGGDIVSRWSTHARNVNMHALNSAAHEIQQRKADGTFDERRIVPRYS
jgi:hypothetical protein